MPIFGIEVLPCPEVDKFCRETNARLKGNDVVINPFTGSIKKIGSILIFNIKPIYHNFTIIFWPILAVMLIILKDYSAWLLFPIGFICAGYFWTASFFYLMAKKGLRKAGYMDTIKKLKLDQVVEAVIFK